jgi:hypothetical protein
VWNPPRAAMLGARRNRRAAQFSVVREPILEKFDGCNEMEAAARSGTLWLPASARALRHVILLNTAGCSEMEIAGNAPAQTETRTPDPVRACLAKPAGCSGKDARRR